MLLPQLWFQLQTLEPAGVLHDVYHGVMNNSSACQDAAGQLTAPSLTIRAADASHWLATTCAWFVSAGPAVPAGRLGDTGLGGGGGRAQRGQRVSRLASGTAHRSVPLSNGASQRSRAAGQINGSRNRAAAAGSKPGVNSDDAGSDTSPGNDPASGYGCQSSSDSNNSSSGSSRGSSDLSSEVDSGSPGSLPHSAANDRRPQLQRAGGQRQAQHREPDSIEATFVTALETASGGADNDLAGRHHLVWSRDRLEGDE